VTDGFAVCWEGRREGRHGSWPADEADGGIESPELAIPFRSAALMGPCSPLRPSVPVIALVPPPRYLPRLLVLRAIPHAQSCFRQGIFLFLPVFFLPVALSPLCFVATFPFPFLCFPPFSTILSRIVSSIWSAFWDANPCYRGYICTARIYWENNILGSSASWTCQRYNAVV